MHKYTNQHANHVMPARNSCGDRMSLRNVICEYLGSLHWPSAQILRRELCRNRQMQATATRLPNGSGTMRMAFMDNCNKQIKK